MCTRTYEILASVAAGARNAELAILLFSRYFCCALKSLFFSAVLKDVVRSQLAWQLVSFD